MDGFEEIHHEKQMLSLGDVFNDDELLDWVKKTEESAHKELEFVAEMKIDGLAMSLVYQDGVLKYAATRGDGMTGEDVTTNVLTIPSIPTRINLMGRVEVRGEIYMPKKSFDSLKKAIKYEKEIRFLDNVVSTKEYKEKVERIKEMSKGILLYSEINDTIELVNKYPLLVQFF